jgi:hypothetical protein
MINEHDCSGHLGQCPTIYQLGVHEPNLLAGPPYDHKAVVECRHCRNILWDKRWALCDKYGWEQWPIDLSPGYEMRYR